MIQTRIKQRFDTESNWLTSNVILLDGELAVVDCGKQVRFKIGNGLSSFTQLKYVDQNQLSTILVNAHAISQGSQSYSTPFGLAAGFHLSANADFSQALGVRSETSAGHSFSFVWNGDQTEYPPVQIGTDKNYVSHGEGTFNINPKNGLSGLYIGEQNFAQILSGYSSKIFIQDPDEAGYEYGKQSDLSIIKLTIEEYADLLILSAVQPNAIYVISGDHEDAFGRQIKNTAPGTDLSDAVIVEQLNDALSSLDNYLPLSGGSVSGQIELCNDANDSIIYAANGITLNDTSMTISSNGNSIEILETDVSIPFSYLIDAEHPETANLRDQFDAKVDLSSLSSYYQKSETSSASQISNAFESIDVGNKIFIDDKISGINGYSDLSVVKLDVNEYATILTSNSLLSNALYVVQDECMNAYGRQLKNLASPTDLSDAATKEYVDSSLSNVEIPDDLSAFTNSPGYLVSNDIKISYINQTIWLSSKAYVTSVDCADFIKDGMLSTVELCGTTLVMSFNTDASSNPISVQLSNFVDNYDSKIQTLSNAIDNKIFVLDSISSISGYSDLSVVKLNANEYATLLTSNQLLSNALYIVEDSYTDAYGQQIKNVATPIDLSDAANKEYVDQQISGIVVPTDLSAFTNSPGYLSAHQSLSDYYQKSETSSASEISTALTSINVGNKVFIDDRISGIVEQTDLSIVHLSSNEYEQLCANGQILSNALYIVEDSFTNNYGKQIKNVAEPVDANDAATKGYVDSQISSKPELSDINDAINEQVVPAIFKNVQLVKPRQAEGYRLHFRGDIAKDDQFEDLVVAGFDSASQERWQFFKYFVANGLSGTWETMLSTGFYTDANDVPASFYFADALSSLGEHPTISSQYFLRYFWYYELSGIERRSDQFSIAIPSNTAVGANPGDVIHKDEFYSLKQSVEPQKQLVGLDEDYNQYFICQATKLTEITAAVNGQFNILLDGYEANKPYRMQFTVSQEADVTPRFYVDYGNGPELATELSVNQDSYVFKAGKKYYTELQNDILKVDTFGYSSENSANSRYQLVTAQLWQVGQSGLSCQVGDQTITTIPISSSALPVSVYLPPVEVDGARDFIIRLEVTTSTVPTIGFYSSLNESVDFESEDESWMEIEPGLNLISFTETK